MKTLILSLIRWYQTTISPNTRPHCRFIPTCSEYAVEAVERFGVVRGLILALWRFLRCNPLFKGGYDPVPEKRQRRRKM